MLPEFENHWPRTGFLTLVLPTSQADGSRCWGLSCALQEADTHVCPLPTDFW